jgi:hypothetical protein
LEVLGVEVDVDVDVDVDAVESSSGIRGIRGGKGGMWIHVV